MQGLEHRQRIGATRAQRASNDSPASVAAVTSAEKGLPMAAGSKAADTEAGSDVAATACRIEVRAAIHRAHLPLMNGSPWTAAPGRLQRRLGPVTRPCLRTTAGAQARPVAQYGVGQMHLRRAPVVVHPVITCDRDIHAIGVVDPVR